MKILANDGISQSGIDALTANGFDVITVNVAQEQLVEYINTNDIKALLVRSATTARKELIDACPGLQLIGRGGVGMDNIDVDYAKSKGLHVINTPASSSASVAELVFAHLYGGVRFLYDSNRSMPLEGETNFKGLKKAYAKGVELRGKTLGIIGFGRIGQAMASRCHFGFGMKINIYSKSKVSDELLKKYNAKQFSTVEALLSKSDFVSLHCPGGTNNRHLINASNLAEARPGLILINTARGEVIDEAALANALENNVVKAAGLDVFDGEPKINPVLMSAPNLVMLPHLGSATKETREEMGFRALENCKAFFQGETPLDKVA